MKRMKPICAAAAVCAALLLPAAAHATFAGRNGLVAYTGHFVQGGKRFDGIWTMRPDGSRRTRIATLAQVKGRPVWSPGGTTIAFSGRRRGDRDEGVLTVRSDGRRLRRVTRLGFDPEWSPSGRRIEFERLEGDQFTHWSVPARGGKPRRIGAPSGVRSLDGTASARVRPDGLIEIDRTGRPAVVVPREDRGSRFVSVSWSPDGRRLLFTSLGVTDPDCNGNCTFLFSFGTVRRDGAGLRYLEHRKHDDDAGQFAAWSPDSRLISYCHPHQVAYGRRDERWVMRADGTHRRFVSVAGCAGDWQALPRVRKALP